jgi:hypothetical protein
MNDERDPLLESLFSQAERELVEDQFTLQVMDRVEKRRRNVLIGRVAIVALIIVLELLLSAPLQNTAGVITQALGTSLIEVESGWLTLIFAPLNSIAGLIGMLLLGMQFLYRRMVR